MAHPGQPLHLKWKKLCSSQFRWLRYRWRNCSQPSEIVNFIHNTQLLRSLLNHGAHFFRPVGSKHFLGLFISW